MLEPIKPSEISKKIPEEVIRVINDLITLHFRDGADTVYQDDIMDILPCKLNMTRREIFNENYLDIEDLYSKYWNVIYHKPPYFEDWEAYFVFKEKLND